MRATALLALTVALTACGSTSRPAARPPFTLPGASPPQLTVNHAADSAAPGYLFVGAKGGKDRPSGGVIADDRGRIRWYHQVPPGLEVADFRAQRYRGRPVLTWWQGTISKVGVGRGEYVVYDEHYRHLFTVRAANGLVGDLHEFQLTPRGTAYISIYDEVPMDLTAVGGPADGYAYDSVVQEIDLATGKVVFEWHSLDHVPLAESLQANQEPARNASKQRPLDYFHVNSVGDGPRGTIIVSARNTSALYLVARDGRIVWRLGGKNSDFGPPAAVKFRFQHNAVFHGAATLSLFDNGAIPKLEPFSRPIVLQLDEDARTAKVVRSFVHPTKISSPFEGNLQLLPDGGALVGWGGVKKVTEFTPGGAVRLELELPYGDTYRGYKLPWNGSPATTRPELAVRGDRVYASWNGRMDVAHWDVLAGPDRQHLARVAGHDWAGLETVIQLETPPPAVAVRALAADGRTLGVSETVTP